MKKFNFKKFLSNQGTILVLILMIIVATILYKDTFFSWSNFANVLRQISWFGMAAIGVNLCIICGGRDVSAGNTAMLTGMFYAYLVAMNGWNVFLAIPAALLVGVLVGVLNGFVVSYLDVRPMIATISIGWMLQSIALLLNNDSTIYINKKTENIQVFYKIARGNILGIPTPFIIFIILVIGFYLFATKSPTGRAIYAVGGDGDSAKMMGINVRKTKFVTHLICSILAAIAGLFLIARTGIGDPVSCSQWGFTLMSTVVIGGTRMRGGVGDLRGIIIGCLIYGLIGNILSMAGLTVYWQNLITGIVLLIAILVQKR